MRGVYRGEHGAGVVLLAHLFILTLPMAAQGELPGAVAKTTDIELIGNVRFQLLDEDSDGLAEALAVDVEARLNAAGKYALIGLLSKGGRQIANRPAWESMSKIRATLDEKRGTYPVRLRCSGEQIYRSGEDGPYDLQIIAIAASGMTSAVFSTPPLDHIRFGEVNARILGVTVAVSSGAGGQPGDVEVILDLDVRRDADFRLQGALAKSGQTLVNAGLAVSLRTGARQIALRFDGAALRIHGTEGPYDGNVNLIDAEGHTLDGIAFNTEPP